MIDNQLFLKQAIDKEQPSTEKKLAMLFLLAMPKEIERRVVKDAMAVMTKNKVTDKDAIKLGIVLGLLSASVKQVVKQASTDKNWQDKPTDKPH